MPKPTLADFLAPAHKQLARTHTIQEAAEETAVTFSAIAAQQGVGKVAVITGQIEKWVDAYFLDVAQFKLSHGFAIDGRVNQSKIAALTLRLLAYEEPSEWFAIPDQWKGTDDELLLFFDFIYNSVRGILFISKMPNDERCEFLQCVQQNMDDICVEWLIVMMRMLCLAHGKPDKGIGD
jgi:hypothetical protein